MEHNFKYSRLKMYGQALAIVKGLCREIFFWRTIKLYPTVHMVDFIGGAT
jgi:hypothetical protein